jgi:hypothetical protein
MHLLLLLLLLLLIPTEVQYTSLTSVHLVEVYFEGFIQNAFTPPSPVYVTV